jgi:hypothetical protein
MSKYKVEVNAENTDITDTEDDNATPSNDHHDIGAKAVTVGVVVVGAALFEAALIPGIVLGAAAMLAPKWFPKIEKSLHPIFDTTVRGVYKLGRKAQNAVGEVKEHMSDIAAEVKAEELSKAGDTAQAVESVSAPTA